LMKPEKTANHAIELIGTKDGTNAQNLQLKN